jgi:hypothetical protein
MCGACKAQITDPEQKRSWFYRAIHHSNHHSTINSEIRFSICALAPSGDNLKFGCAGFSERLFTA